VRRLVLAGLLAAMSGCSKSTPPPPAAETPAAPPVGASATESPNGTVVGKVTGTGGATAVVVLEPKSARTFPVQSEPPVMDQAGLTFGPELLLVRTGEPVEFRNSDDTLHNVHVTHEETKTPAFNVAIPTGNSYTHTFDRDGFYRVGCDIHPSMAASIFAATTPYTTLAGTDGSFTFTDVAAGAWTVSVYTGGKRLHKDVDVKSGVTDVTVE
jgi:plastocyanin